MMTDPISNFLIQIKNGYMARKNKVVVLHNSKFKEDLANLLSREGYIGKVEVKKEGKVKRNLEVVLNYKNKKPALNEIAIVSKPGKKVYVRKDMIPRVLGGLGKVVISTSSGIMTGGQARKKGLGGEIICKIW